MTNSTDNRIGQPAYSRAAACLFDNRQQAGRAVARLHQAGILPANVRMIDGASAGATPGTGDDPAFRQPVEGMPFPDEDRACYAEGLARGCTLVAALDLDDAQHDLALVILDEEGAVDLTAREAEWRQQGWSGGIGEGVLPSGVRGTTLDTTYTNPRDGNMNYEGTSMQAGTNPPSDTPDSPVQDRQGSGTITGVRDTSRGPARSRSYLVGEHTRQ
nr:FAD-linked oxidase C-terminal domain-containing protein [Paracoccus saliphilus]